jgi:C4-dicarboxylate transporter, DctM subunit
MKLLARVLRWLESGTALAAVAVIVLLPIAQAIVRLAFKGGIPAAEGYVTHSVVVLAFFAALVTTRNGMHIGLAAGLEAASGGLKTLLVLFNALVASAATTALGLSALSFAFIAFPAEARIGFIPTRIVAFAMPIGYLGMALSACLGAKLPPRLKALALLGMAAGLFAGLPALANWQSGAGQSELPAFLARLLALHDAVEPALFWPAVAALVLGAATGAPIFAVLGGLALALFAHSGGALENAPQEAFNLLRQNYIPAIPLFTIAGFLLSEGDSGKRLVEVFRSLFGWIPGGMVVVAVVVSAFFCTFTGDTGVSILALGGMLSYVLTRSGYSEDFAHGLLASSGSIGLLFPPSLAAIVYAFNAQIDVTKLFLAGLVPNLLIVVAMCVAGLVLSRKIKAPTFPFSAWKALSALRASLWELLLPVIIVAGYFTGLGSLAEIAAVAVLYVVVVEVFVLREIRLSRLPSVMMKSVAVVGGTLAILASAKGLSFYIVDAEVASAVSAWIRTFVSSPVVFLLIVNAILLVCGCFMDIFSSILIVAMLIIPIGADFGINPYHLAVIFIANMGIGYLTPLVGINVFLASYTFKRPVTGFPRLVLPYYLTQLAVVLAVTYVPWLSTALLPK